MPYYPNGTWYNWTSYTQTAVNSIQNGSSDPITANIHAAASANPILFPFFLGALYVWLWVRFANAPTRFKLAGMTALVLVVSIAMFFGGFIADAVLNLLAFMIAYFLSFLFRN